MFQSSVSLLAAFISPEVTAVGGVFLAAFGFLGGLGFHLLRTKQLRARVAEMSAETQKRIKEAERLAVEKARAEKELDNAKETAEISKEVAEAASQAKSDFLASVTHELRTPLNGVLGMNQLILDSELTADQRQCAETVRQSAENLLIIINDILDLSKIEAGKMIVKPAPFDLQLVVEEVADLVGVKAKEKGVEMIVRFHATTPRHLIGDAGRVRQILTNLCGNAVKFTAKGHVLIQVESRGQNGPEVRMYIAVKDTGIGIPTRKLSHIFEKFVQADSSTTRKYGGTGLGLAICRQMVQLMGGRMGVESIVSSGSNFWFELPLQVAEQPTESADAAADSAALNGLHLLIADGNATSRSAIEEQVKAWGVRTAAAESHEQTLQLLRDAVASGDPFQLALLDGETPGMNPEVLRRSIQEDPRLASLPLILMSSSRLRLSGQGVAPGFASVIVKPARSSRMRAALSQALRGEMKSPAPEGTPQTPAATPPVSAVVDPQFSAHVLLAEDNEINVQVAKRLLEKLGCRVDWAADGVIAVQMARDNNYDLVFMDCEMPEMNGYDATRAIRQHEKSGTRHVPVIAMTAHIVPEARQRCIDSGMDSYLSKPLRKAELAEALSGFLKAK